MGTIKDLQSSFAEFRDVRDWKQFHTPKDLASAISIEASELQEIFLWKSNEQISSNREELRPEVEAELADIFAFTLAFADIYQIDLEEAFKEKMKANQEKYPEGKVKGSAKKYDKY
jgi:NTP pyrophosphatase (non-canonical NTP hydrolase)